MKDNKIIDQTESISGKTSKNIDKKNNGSLYGEADIAEDSRMNDLVRRGDIFKAIMWKPSPWLTLQEAQALMADRVLHIPPVKTGKPGKSSAAQKK